MGAPRKIIRFDADRAWHCLKFHLFTKPPNIAIEDMLFTEDVPPSVRALEQVTPDSLYALRNDLRATDFKASIDREKWRGMTDEDRLLWIVVELRVLLIPLCGDNRVRELVRFVKPRRNG